MFGGRLRECVQVFRECLALGLNRGQNLIIKTHTCEAAGGGKWGGGFLSPFFSGVRSDVEGVCWFDRMRLSPGTGVDE